MFLALDLVTLLTVLWMVMLLMAVVMGATWLRERDNEAPGMFALGFLVSTLGIGIGALYQSVPAWAWAIVAPAAVLTGEALFWAGLRRFDGRRANLLVLLSVPAAYVILCVATGVWVNQPIRGAIFSTAFAVLTFGAAHQVHAGRRAEPLPVRAPLAILIAVLSLLHVARVAVAVLALGGYAWATTVLLMQIVSVLAFGLGLFALVKDRAERALRHVADTDQLTGVANRRSFFRLAEAPVEGAVLLIDLDHFKRINDRFGHAVGDEVLVRLSQLVTARVRAVDTFARIGGEEFALFLPGCDALAAAATAERLRRAVSGLRIEAAGTPVPVTVSVGIAATEGAPVPLETLLARADRALYRAKEAGRNRTRGEREADGRAHRADAA